MKSKKSMGIRRRTFLRKVTFVLGGTALAPAILAQENRPLYKACIIGHTGRGNYGHELELIFRNRPDVSVAAVADPDAEGRARAAARTQALRAYADYRLMLEREKPQLVCVAPRWTDQHHAMALAALKSGAHVFMEKPIAPSLVPADELLRVADAAKLKIAVAHQMRLAPNILFLNQCLQRGEVGALLEIRAHGKQDSRAGGEDLIVLGVHLFNLMRFFAGHPLWCAARVSWQGHEIAAQDVRAATEEIGPVAGDEIFAQFAFEKGVNATFTSRAQNREIAGPWGMELIGSKGIYRIMADIAPRVFQFQQGSWSEPGRPERWEPIPGDPMAGAPLSERTVERANARAVDDWLQAIRDEREPVCSGLAATQALELAMAVFAAGLKKTRVEFPLVERRHPLGELPARK